MKGLKLITFCFIVASFSLAFWTLLNWGIYDMKAMECAEHIETFEVCSRDAAFEATAYIGPFVALWAVCAWLLRHAWKKT